MPKEFSRLHTSSANKRKSNGMKLGCKAGKMFSFLERYLAQSSHTGIHLTAVEFRSMIAETTRLFRYFHLALTKLILT